MENNIKEILSKIGNIGNSMFESVSSFGTKSVKFITNKGNNALYTQVTPGSNKPLKREDTAADIAAKMYNFMLLSYKDEKKYNDLKILSDKKRNSNRDKQFKDTLKSLGKKPGDEDVEEKKSSLGLLGVAAVGIGSMLYSEDAEAGMLELVKLFDFRDLQKKIDKLKDIFSLGDIENVYAIKTTEKINSNIVKIDKLDNKEMMINAWKWAKESEKKYGVSADITMGQFGLESSFGKHTPKDYKTGEESYNPFGIKAGKNQPFVRSMTDEFENGKMVRKVQKFKKFGSFQEAFDAHAKLLATSSYYSTLKDAKTLDEQIIAIKRYATDPNYGEKLKSTIKKAKQYENLKDETQSSLPEPVSDGSNFSVVGNAKTGIDQVDPRLVEIMKESSKYTNYKVEMMSGYRPGDKGSQHSKGLASDIRLVDPVTGEKLNNYQDAKTFYEYEKFAKVARQVQQKKYPELSGNFRWGGYFTGNGNKDNYGELDLMHFDLGGSPTLGMMGGSWDKGLIESQKIRLETIYNKTPEIPKKEPKIMDRKPSTYISNFNVDASQIQNVTKNNNSELNRQLDNIGPNLSQPTQQNIRIGF